MDAAKPNSSMKTNHPTSSITGPDAVATVARYQIYRQNRAGLFLPGYRTDSAPEAVEAFLNQAPAFEGGGVRFLDHHDQRMVSSVEWRTEKTDFGFPMHHRANRVSGRDDRKARGRGADERGYRRPGRASRAGLECQGSNGAAHREKKMCRQDDEGGPPMAHRPSSIMPETTRHFLGRSRLFTGRLRPSFCRKRYVAGRLGAVRPMMKQRDHPPSRSRPRRLQIAMMKDSAHC